MAARSQRQRRPDYDLICGDCGGPHFLDCSLPSEVWNKIARPEEILCPVCIDRRLEDRGLTTSQAEFYYSGRALHSKLYTAGHGELTELRRILRRLLGIFRHRHQGDVVLPNCPRCKLWAEASRALAQPGDGGET